MAQATFRIWRGDASGGDFKDYKTEVSEGMVVLDAVHQVQAESAQDLAVRWNCKAGKCGSCSAEVNGQPRLMCMTRLSDLDLGEPVTLEPMRAFPPIRDLVTDVSWNFGVKKTITKFTPRPPDAPDGTWRIAQDDVDRVQEFRKCIECFLCQDVCHVLRDHQLHDQFIGPRFLVYAAALEMHPLDTADRLADLKEQHGVGFCNITKCCTTVCPEHITITDNAIIPLKERVVDRFYDPVTRPAAHVHGMSGRGPQAMFELKRLSRDAIPAALERAERYRLLNEPIDAESICEDVLAVEPDNQDAQVMLLLSLTDQFSEHLGAPLARARSIAAQARGSVQPALLRRARRGARRQGARQTRRRRRRATSPTPCCVMRWRPTNRPRRSRRPRTTRASFAGTPASAC